MIRCSECQLLFEPKYRMSLYCDSCKEKPTEASITNRKLSKQRWYINKKLKELYKQKEELEGLIRKYEAK